MTAPDPIIAALVAALAPLGFGLVGAADVSAYDRIVDEGRRIGTRAPWARSAIVIGNGGGSLWRHVAAWAAARGGLAALADPVDAYTEQTITAAVADVVVAAGVRSETIFPFPRAGAPSVPSFVDLAAVAGLGAPSLLRVLVHPVFGPWMALRAVVLCDEELRAARPADGFDPCPACHERACVAACPAGAVRAPHGWDLVACIDHRLASGDCADRCHARFDCVHGREHRYPPEATAHHHRRAWAAMRAWRESATKS